MPWVSSWGRGGAPRTHRGTTGAGRVPTRGATISAGAYKKRTPARVSPPLPTMTGDRPTESTTAAPRTAPGTGPLPRSGPATGTRWRGSRARWRGDCAAQDSGGLVVSVGGQAGHVRQAGAHACIGERGPRATVPSPRFDHEPTGAGGVVCCHLPQHRATIRPGGRRGRWTGGLGFAGHGFASLPIASRTNTQRIGTE